MDDLAQLINQAQRDLKALEELDKATGRTSTDAQRLRRQLAQLQARLEANHEQKAA